MIRFIVKPSFWRRQKALGNSAGAYLHTGVTDVRKCFIIKKKYKDDQTYFTYLAPSFVGLNSMRYWMGILRVKKAGIATGLVSSVIRRIRKRAKSKLCSLGEEKPHFARKGCIWQTRCSWWRHLKCRWLWLFCLGQTPKISEYAWHNIVQLTDITDISTVLPLDG